MTLQETLSELCEADPERADWWTDPADLTLLARLVAAIMARFWYYDLEGDTHLSRASVQRWAATATSPEKALASAYLAALKAEVEG